MELFMIRRIACSGFLIFGKNCYLISTDKLLLFGLKILQPGLRITKA